MAISDLLRQIPSVDEMIEENDIAEFETDIQRAYIVQTIREAQDMLRQQLLTNEAEVKGKIENAATSSGVSQREGIKAYLKQCVLGNLREELEESFKRVINCTGTVLHTNLGRAPLAQLVLERVWETVQHYNNLELNMDTGKRGSRYAHIERLITRLTGAESAMVVNNNAAAVMLILNELAQGKEVIMSRGELVEIGGSFRIPEVMKQSGSQLVEVGTTNKTHLEDFEEAITENTGMLMKVHTSNYQIVGFTESVSREVMVALAHDRELFAVEDLGSGLMLDMNQFGLVYEPTIAEVLSSGMDLVTFSGDKLLGGPQAGIIAGKKELVDRLKKNQLNRALRIDKLTLKALEETMRLYLQPEKALKEIPALKFLTEPLENLEKKADRLLAVVEDVLPPDFKAKKEDGYSRVGGGAMPVQTLPTRVVAIENPRQDLTWLWHTLRKQNPPVITRVQDNRLHMDVRTIFSGEEELIAEQIKIALKA